MLLQVEGKFPKGLIPTIMRVEEEKGTFVLYSDKDTQVASGQLYPVKGK